jgi:hypothetical protein
VYVSNEAVSWSKTCTICESKRHKEKREWWTIEAGAQGGESH